MIERVLLKLWACIIFVAFGICFHATIHCDWLEGIAADPTSDQQNGGSTNDDATTEPSTLSQGALRQCKFVGGEEQEDISTLDIMLETPPSAFWKASAITLGIANAIGFLSCFFALVILISCAKCTDEIVSRLQQFICIANVILQIVALVTFLAGLNNDTTEGRCGEGLGMFDPGDCSIGNSLYLLIASIVLQIAGIAVSFVVCVIMRVRAGVSTVGKGLKIAKKLGHDSSDGKSGKKDKKKKKSEDEHSEDRRTMNQWSEEEKEELWQQMTENPEVALIFQQLLSGSGPSSSEHQSHSNSKV